jgi:NCS1 family nucleobase:cation symporter-1
VASGKSFLNFMSAYAIFMAPIAGILFADYWLVKRRHYDVSALYYPRGINCYGKYSTNWRAVTATSVTIVPLLPALAYKVNPKIRLASGLQRLFTINRLYGFFLIIALYYFLNLLFPDKESLIFKAITGLESVEGVVVVDETYSNHEQRQRNLEKYSSPNQL